MPRAGRSGSCAAGTTRRSRSASGPGRARRRRPAARRAGCRTSATGRGCARGTRSRSPASNTWNCSMSYAPAWKSLGGRVGVVARPVVVAVRVRDLEQQRAGRSVEHDGAHLAAGRAGAPVLGDDVEHRRAAGQRHGDREGPARTGRRRRRGRGACSRRCWSPATTIRLPGFDVPCDQHRVADRRVVGRSRDRQRRLALRAPDVALAGVARAVEHAAGGDVEHQPHELAGRPRQRGRRAGAPRRW